MNDTIMKSPGVGVTARKSSTGDMELRGQEASSIEALAARSESMVKARVALALSRPRDWMTVRERILSDAERPGFADKALYSVPRGGGKIEGLTIRAAEALARHMGNLHIDTQIIAEDARLRLVEVTVTDLESNFTETQQITVAKTVERKGGRDGGLPSGVTQAMVLGERPNSYGDRVFLVAATEDEVNTRMNALVSKVRRNKIFEMVPADIKADAEAKVREVRAKVMAGEYKDKAAWLKNLFDAFAALRVTAAQLRTYVKARWSTEVEAITEEQFGDLRGLRSALVAGETTFARELAEFQTTTVDASGEVIDRRTGEVVPTSAPPAPAAATVTVASPPAPEADIAQTQQPKPTPPPPAPSGMAFEEGKQWLEEAKSLPELSTAWSKLQARKGEGALSPDERKALMAVYKTCADALKGAKP